MTTKGNKRRAPQKRSDTKKTRQASKPMNDEFSEEFEMTEREFGDEDYDYESPHRHSGRYSQPRPLYYNSPARNAAGPYPKRSSRSRTNSRELER